MDCPLGLAEAAFRGLDPANEQLELNRDRFEERTGRLNRGLDNAIDRTMRNRDRFDDRLDDRLDSAFDEHLNDGSNDGFQDNRGAVNRR